MSETQSLPPESDSDDELKQALAAAFGEDAIGLLNDDDSDEISAHVLAPVGDEHSVTLPETPLVDGDEIGNDEDVSPLIRYVKQLSKAIYGDGPAALPNAGPLGTNEQQSASRAPRFVVFAVGDQQFGLPLSDVREIARYPKVTELPRTPPWLRGVTNLRSQILSVADLRSLLQISGERPGLGEKIIVVHSKQNAASTALVVDRVLGIRGFGDQQGTTSDLSQSVAEIASGTAMIDQVTTVLLDVDQLFDSAELLTLA